MKEPDAATMAEGSVSTNPATASSKLFRIGDYRTLPPSPTHDKNLLEDAASSSVRGSSATSPHPQGEIAKININQLVSKIFMKD